MQGQETDIRKRYQNKVLNKKYKISHCFDSGGYGYIFYAEDFNQNSYAIKIIDIQKAQKQDQKLIKLLDQEPFSMLACNNDHIMKCREVIQCPNQKIKVIVMDYCQYGSLEQFIYIRVKLPQSEAKIILKQILYGLADFHRNGFIHRDIKSGNFCIKDDNVILCDFGSSRYLQDGKDKYSWRKTFKFQGTITGTRYYKSPEMIQGFQYGLRTDLWGVGLIFYEMLTGIHPFDFNGDFQKKQLLSMIKQTSKVMFNPSFIRQKLQEQGYAISEQSCKISPQAQGFLTEMLKFDQNDRIGWEKLLRHPYLMGKKQQNFARHYQRPECSFPLKYLDWKQVFMEYDEEMKAHKYEFKEKDTKILPKIQSLTELQKNEVSKLVIRFNRKYEDFQKNMKLVKQLHFQVRRICLMLAVREQLSFYQNNLVKLGCAISKYCFLKLQQVRQNYQAKMNHSFYSSLELPKLMEQKIKPALELDKDFLQGIGDGVTKEYYIWLKGFFRGKQDHKHFLELLQGNCLEKIIEAINYYCKKLQSKANQTLQQYPNLNELMNHSNLLLTVAYTVKDTSTRQQWKQWKNFRQIRKQFVK